MQKRPESVYLKRPSSWPAVSISLSEEATRTRHAISEFHCVADTVSQKNHENFPLEPRTFGSLWDTGEEALSAEELFRKFPP